ncbi:uncharacterized protein LOC118917952 isoform X7 [Manis pentadactyla]|uniref:uncharacterized protein LOC118917952 isoform X7 n=1 Tax=Manis pentadactyla TaxID=143292 RepID=UPI00255CBE65|nr:uncharacterized protein LOC118917952 isoform X7 [Manis pentadactyla]
MPQTTQAHADCGDRAVQLGGGVTCHMPPESCGEDTGTTAQPRRARLYRCHWPIQTSKSSLAPPAALPLKGEASGVWGLGILPCVNRHRPLEGPGGRGLQLWAVPAAGCSSPVSLVEFSSPGHRGKVGTGKTAGVVCRRCQGQTPDGGLVPYRQARLAH